MVQKVKCKECQEFFHKEDIFVTFQGFYCERCIPEDVNKRFFTVHFTWTGADALVAYINGDANLDQLMIIDKIKEKLERQILYTIREMVKHHDGEVQEEP